MSCICFWSVNIFESLYVHKMINSFIKKIVVNLKRIVIEKLIWKFSDSFRGSCFFPPSRMFRVFVVLFLSNVFLFLFPLRRMLLKTLHLSQNIMKHLIPRGMTSSKGTESHLELLCGRRTLLCLQCYII